MSIIFHARLYLHAFRTRRTKERSLGTFKSNVLSNFEDQWIGKYFYLVFKGLLHSKSHWHKRILRRGNTRNCTLEGEGLQPVAQTHYTCVKIDSDFTEVTKKIHLKPGRILSKRYVLLIINMVGGRN